MELGAELIAEIRDRWERSERTQSDFSFGKLEKSTDPLFMGQKVLFHARAQTKSDGYTDEKKNPLLTLLRESDSWFSDFWGLLKAFLTVEDTATALNKQRWVGRSHTSNKQKGAVKQLGHFLIFNTGFCAVNKLLLSCLLERGRTCFDD